MKTLVIFGLTSVLLLACTVTGFLPGSRPPTPTAPAAPIAPATPTSASALTVEQVKNMQVTLQARDTHPTVQLKDGVYKSGNDPTAPDFVSVNMPGQIAFGDLNHDGSEDAAALLAENYGGTGVFTSVLAILSVNGSPVQAGGYMIDDRPMPSGLVIQGRKIVFSGAIHGPNDPGCCPTFPVVETLGLTKGGLQVEQLASRTPTGQLRAINIESPKDGEQVPAGPVQLRGSFTISPFENTFACKVTDATGKEWYAGPMTVQGEAGQPGVFDQEIDLSMVPPGLLVRIQIIDVSAADGSTLAMNSIELMLK